LSVIDGGFNNLSITQTLIKGIVSLRLNYKNNIKGYP